MKSELKIGSDLNKNTNKENNVRKCTFKCVLFKNCQHLSASKCKKVISAIN